MPVTTTLGNGQGLIRLLQFSGQLSGEDPTVCLIPCCVQGSALSTLKQKLRLSYWIDFIRDYFTPAANMRFTLWKDNQRNEAKPFGK